MAYGLLSGKLSIITGAGSGIGRAVCQVFAKEGARVAMVDVDEGNLIQTLTSLGDGHCSFIADVSSHSSVTDLSKAVLEKFKNVPSIVVNCAGVTADSFFLKMDESTFNKVIDVNLKGTFLIMQAFGRCMAEAKVQNGSIVNISSISGKTGNIGQSNYAASKAGVIALTKSAAREMAEFGIRCNAVLPGLIRTPMVERMPPKVLNAMLKQIPLGRIGESDDVAQTCLFLASEKSSYITGATIEVTGGLLM